jgi:hypothetical protein
MLLLCVVEEEAKMTVGSSSSSSIWSTTEATKNAITNLFHPSLH